MQPSTQTAVQVSLGFQQRFPRVEPFRHKAIKILARSKPSKDWHQPCPHSPSEFRSRMIVPIDANYGASIP